MIWFANWLILRLLMLKIDDFSQCKNDLIRHTRATSLTSLESKIKNNFLKQCYDFIIWSKSIQIKKYVTERRRINYEWVFYCAIFILCQYFSITKYHFPDTKAVRKIENNKNQFWYKEKNVWSFHSSSLKSKFKEYFTVSNEISIPGWLILEDTCLPLIFTIIENL